MSHNAIMRSLEAAIAAFDTGALQPVQVRMFRMLSDMFPHHSHELLACLYDEQSIGTSTIRFHITRLRKALRLSGIELVTEMRDSGTYYRLSTPIHRSESGGNGISPPTSAR